VHPWEHPKQSVVLALLSISRIAWCPGSPSPMRSGRIHRKLTRSRNLHVYIANFRTVLS